MSEITAPGSGVAAARATEESAFYHEAALNAAWTGSRLALGGMSFLFGCFAFAYFFLQSSNGHSKWLPSSTTPPQEAMGAGRARGPGPRSRRGCAADRPAHGPAVPAGPVRLRQRLRRVLPGRAGDLAGGHDLAGDTRNAGSRHPGDLLRRAAADLC